MIEQRKEVADQKAESLLNLERNKNLDLEQKLAKMKEVLDNQKETIEKHDIERKALYEKYDSILKDRKESLEMEAKLRELEMKKAEIEKSIEELRGERMSPQDCRCQRGFVITKEVYSNFCSHSPNIAHYRYSPAERIYEEIVECPITHSVKNVTINGREVYTKRGSVGYLNCQYLQYH